MNKNIKQLTLHSSIDLEDYEEWKDSYYKNLYYFIKLKIDIIDVEKVNKFKTKIEEIIITLFDITQTMC